MINDSLKIDSCTRYKYPHGAVYLGPSNETLSSGFLELAPGQATPKMTRPLPEHVKQISGTSEIEMFDDQNRISIKKLGPNETFIIPTGIVRVHRNRTNEPSINYWEYQGNALALIDQIKADGILDEKFQPPPSPSSSVVPSSSTAPTAPRSELRSATGVPSNYSSSLPIQPSDCEIYRLPTAKIYIGKSDSTESYGYLELKPGMAMDKHNRPVMEELIQVKGVGEIELFDMSNQITTKKLQLGEKLTIPADQLHVHSNKGADDSLTFWHFRGDITAIIADIRTQGIKIS